MFNFSDWVTPFGSYVYGVAKPKLKELLQPVINRVSQTAYEKLILRGIDEKKIDGGLSKNGSEGTLSQIENTHEYILTFNNLEHYEQVESITFYRWLFLQEDQLLILRKRN